MTPPRRLRRERLLLPIVTSSRASPVKANRPTRAGVGFSPRYETQSWIQHIKAT
jgi:hypothetical protein